MMEKEKFDIIDKKLLAFVKAIREAKPENIVQFRDKIVVLV